MAEPTRTLPDGTPCWCVDPQHGHEPRCQTQRAFAGVKGVVPDHLAQSAGAGARAHGEALKVAFLESYANLGIIRSACEEAGIVRSTVDNWRKVDPDFAARMLQARQEATDRLEREALRRGVEGVEKPVYQGGVEVGAIREYSDPLLMLMLKANDPKRYRENIRAEVSGPDGGAIVHEVLPSMQDHERQLLRKVLEEAVAAQEALEAESTTAVSGNVG